MSDCDFTAPLSPGEHPETLYIEPRSDFDTCVLRLENGVAVYDGDAVTDVFYKQFLKDLKDSEETAGHEYSEYGESAEERARIMAIEWFEYNVSGAYLGKYTPQFVFKDAEE
ncbi:MAG: hypothetical protein ACXAEN_16890 [Candidatus Thorarchaeota archaeon]|jgi:hypothetical protein